jgi:hypothetical protein
MRDENLLNKKNRRFGPLGNIVVRRFLNLPVVALLLAAACLKAHQLSTTPNPNHLVLGSRALSTTLVLGEFFLAVWLFAGKWPRLCKNTVLCVFAIFSFVALILIFNGESSCGCFGDFSIPPHVTLLFDIAALALVICWSPKETNATVVGALIAIASILAAIMVLKIIQFESKVLSDIGSETYNGVVIIDPENWKGRELPLSEFIEGPETPHKSGVWQVILYDEHCEKCQQLVSKALRGEIAPSTIFVEIPPYSGVQRTDSENIYWRKLSDGYDWFVEAPLVIKIADGKVLD